MYRAESLTINIKIMRATFRNLFVAMCAFALAAMGMISCKNGEEGEPPIEDKYNAAAVNYVVAVEDYDVNLYTLTLAEKSLDIDAAGNVLDGDGKVIVVQFLSNSENEPAEGDYEVRDDATESLEDFSILPGSATSSGVSGSCVLDYADGQLTSLDQVLAAPIEGEGSMSLKKTDKGWRIIVKFINLEGEEEEYAYEGALEFISALEAAFIDEPDDVAPSVSSFDYALFASYGSGMNIIQLATADNTSLLNLLILDTSVAVAADCYGKSYTIDLSMGDGTILGCGSDVSMNYSCLYVDVTLDSYGYIVGGTPYWLVSGNVSVSEDGIVTVDAVSGKNHAVKATATSELTDVETESAPAKIQKAKRFTIGLGM